MKFEVLTDETEIMALEPLVQALLEESRFGKAQYSREKLQKIADKSAADPSRHGFLVAYQNDKPVGFVYCGIGEPLIGTGLLITNVHALFVDKKVRNSLLGGKVANGLLNGVLHWNQARNGEEVLIHLTSGIRPQDTHRFLKRRRFDVVGGSYANRDMDKGARAI